MRFFVAALLVAAAAVMVVPVRVRGEGQAPPETPGGEIVSAALSQSALSIAEFEQASDTAMESIALLDRAWKTIATVPREPLSADAQLRSSLTRVVFSLVHSLECKIDTTYDPEAPRNRSFLSLGPGASAAEIARNNANAEKAMAQNLFRRQLIVNRWAAANELRQTLAPMDRSMFDMALSQSDLSPETRAYLSRYVLNEPVLPMFHFE